jgi:hypothetical protein
MLQGTQEEEAPAGEQPVQDLLGALAPAQGVVQGGDEGLVQQRPLPPAQQVTHHQPQPVGSSGTQPQIPDELQQALTGKASNVEVFYTALDHLLAAEECISIVAQLGTTLSLETLLATPVQSLRLLLKFKAIQEAQELLRDTVVAVKKATSSSAPK